MNILLFCSVAQLLSYMKLLNKPVALSINSHEIVLKKCFQQNTEKRR
jgi:hypothetical protein